MPKLPKLYRDATTGQYTTAADAAARPAETVSESVPTRMLPLNNLAAAINDNARAHGFWDADRNFGEMLMLVTSELAEALEEHRAGRPNVYCLPEKPDKPEGVAVELADALIRILDTMHSLGVDIDAVVADKMAYNASRPFKHGKAY